ncbi:hypothetical protein NQ317_001034 [Molorchus minor]|uniref:AMP-dependent synthetase/ligase domain-containing protein n=1 Tax=Molorchus minor TaxID=1323400 RepID=A0ABQ9IS38_9CUCU|nr:hypothetical protein NQ317_001034 [Molorchus minor]
MLKLAQIWFPVSMIATVEILQITLLKKDNTLFNQEIYRQLMDSSAKAIITLPDLYTKAKSSALAMKKHIPIVVIKTKNNEVVPEEAINFMELIFLIFNPESSDDIALLPYSSGTTGLSKGVELTHYNIVSNMFQIDHPDVQFIFSASGSRQEVLPAVLPMFHVYGFTLTSVITLSKGSRVITLRKFTPDSFINFLKNYNTTIMFAAPPLKLYHWRQFHWGLPRKKTFKKGNHVKFCKV